MIKRLLKAITASAYIMLMAYASMLGAQLLVEYGSIKVVLMVFLIIGFVLLTAFFYLTQGK